MDPFLERDEEAPYLRWATQPKLRSPVLVAAFEGWNDAGDAATTAVSYLHDRWGAAIVADIDPEEFYDFTSTRPRVEVDDDLTRHIVWPANEFSVTVRSEEERDIVFLRGVEPELRWRTFCDQLIRLVRVLDIELVVTLGALLAEVPHSRPVSVFGAAYDEQLAGRLDLTPSRYEGPTGIVGVLHAACHDAGIPSASLWAAVPTYVPGSPSPKAALALVKRACVLLESAVGTDELEEASTVYVDQINDLVNEDDETAEYVAGLEERYDDEIAGVSSEALVEEVERYLREQPD